MDREELETGQTTLSRRLVAGIARRLVWRESVGSLFCLPISLVKEEARLSSCRSGKEMLGM